MSSSQEKSDKSDDDNSHEHRIPDKKLKHVDDHQPSDTKLVRDDDAKESKQTSSKNVQTAEEESTTTADGSLHSAVNMQHNARSLLPSFASGYFKLFYL